MSQAATTELSKDDREKIAETTRKFMKRMLAGDVAGLAQLYAADGVLIPPNHPIVRGRSEIEAFLGTFPRATTFSAWNDEIDGRGDLAYVRGNYELTMKADGGESVDVRGTYLEIRRRQSDGSWPIAVDMYSSDFEAS